MRVIGHMQDVCALSKRQVVQEAGLEAPQHRLLPYVGTQSVAILAQAPSSKDSCGAPFCGDMKVVWCALLFLIPAVAQTLALFDTASASSVYSTASFGAELATFGHVA